MLALSLRGLASRKLRTALTAFAVVLGIALVSGTYLLTDTIDSSFDEVFQTASKGVDVSITPRRAFSNVAGEELPASALEGVRKVPGVEEAVGSISFAGVIYDRDDEPLIENGAPMLILSDSPPRFNPFTYAEGHGPRAPDEVALDKASVDRAGYSLGDTVRLSGDGPQEAFRLVGIARFGDLDSMAGAAAAIVETPVAQRLAGLEGRFTSMEAAGEPGVRAQELANRVREALPSDGFTVRTGEEEARTQAADLQDQLGFLRTFLFVFAGIALFVGAFLIVNTFSITVAQRVREFALLRMIGATRRQVLWAVVGEALVVGFAASVVGLLLGFAIAPGLRALFKAFGADLPQTGIVVEPRTVVVSLLAGTLITLAAALAPALRATRVPPIAALQEAASLPRGRGARWRTPLSAGVVAIGVALLCVGLFGSSSGSSAAGLVGAGAAVVFIGVGLLASHIVPPIAAVVGVPLEGITGVPGRLARENAVRNPRRTAATSAALMIGVALVAFVAIFADGLKASIDRAVDTGLRASLIVQSESFQPVPQSATPVLESVDGVGVVAPVRFSTGDVRGVGRVDVTGVDPRTVNEAFEVDWTDGSPQTIERLGIHEATVKSDWADDHGVAVGDRIAVRTPTGATTELTVRGIYDDEAGLFGSVTVTDALLEREFNVDSNAFVVATTTPGADPDDVKRAADRAIRSGYPSLEVLTKQEFKDQQAGQVDQIVLLFYVLLSLSVLVSLFGIVNTLMLAIHERTRELGMLRAIGTSRRQVRQTVRYEAVITALIGAVLGVVLGAIFAVLVSIPLRSEGFTISIPIVTLVLLLVLSVLAGVLAAIWPARRGAKLDVLRALSYE